MNSQSTQTRPWTPGPWVCYHDGPSVEPNWHIITNESRMRILANVHIEPGNTVDRANANLIAASPKMFDLLERLCSAIGPASIEDNLAGNEVYELKDEFLELREELLAGSK